MNDQPPLADFSRYSAPCFDIVHGRLAPWHEGMRRTRSAAPSLGLSFTDQHCLVEIDGRTAERFIGRGEIVSVGIEPVSWLAVDRHCEIIEVSASRAMRAVIADELQVASWIDLRDATFQGSPAAWTVASRLRAVARGQVDNDPLLAEELVRRFWGHVLKARFGGRLREKGDGALDARRLQRVTEYIAGNLQQKLDLATLAHVAALSPFHFLRSFRRAVGCTPHQFVALKKAEFARECLERGQVPAEVARRLGYADTRRLRLALAKHLAV